jgi:hypothetical protein
MTPTLAQKYPEAHALIRATGRKAIAEMMEGCHKQKDLAEALDLTTPSMSAWMKAKVIPRKKYDIRARAWLKSQRKTEPVPEPTYEPRPVPIAAPFPQIQHEKKMLMVAVNGNESQVRKALEFLNCEVFE